MRTLLLFIALLTFAFAHGQDPSLQKKITIKIWVTTDGKAYAGYLADITDSTLVIAQTPVQFRQAFLNTQPIAYNSLSVVTYKRKGAVGRGIWIGGLSGMVAGGITGAITYRPCNECLWDFGAGYDVLGGALIGLGVGALTGGIIGALSSKTITIGGNKEKFNKMRKNVLDMTYRKVKSQP